jgi:hypothetical protein
MGTVEGREAIGLPEGVSIGAADPGVDFVAVVDGIVVVIVGVDFSAVVTSRVALAPILSFAV